MEYISCISKDAGLHSGKNFKWKGFISKLCKAEKELHNWPRHLPLGDVFAVSYASMSTATFEQLWVICNEASDNSLLSIRSIPLGSDAIVVADNGETLLTKAEVEEFGCASEPLKHSQKGKHSQQRSMTVQPSSSDC